MITIDQIIAEKLGSWEIDGWPIGNFFLCTIALLLAVVLCGAIGFEREKKGSNAGLRTHLLVGMGSCLIMIISIYGFPIIYPLGEFKRDVARLAAAVVTGVGFLGAGAIIHRNAGIKGLTTAATIWIVMAIGLACGSMNFLLAIGTTILILIVLTVFRKVESKINKDNPLVTIKVGEETGVVTRVLELIKASENLAQDLHIEMMEDKGVEISFVANAANKEVELAKLIDEIKQVEGVKHISVNKAHK